MPALPPVLVIARLTVQEASRRKLLLALVILTLIVVGISAWGFYKITTVTGPNGKPPSHEEVIIVSSQMLIFVTFVYSVVLALTAVDWATTYVPPQPVELIIYVGLEGLALLSLGLLLSTRLSGITGGVIALVAWLMAWIGGIVGDIGTGLQNEAVQDVGIVSRLILPTDGLWRGAITAMDPDVILAQLRGAGAFARANPFAALDPPPVAFLLWVAVWFSLILFLSIWSFRTREI